jgi:hypothetical protein
MSLSEIAEERGISRQGVHDLIRRCDRILQDYESKLHLVERFAKARKTVQDIQKLADCQNAKDEGTQDPEEVVLRERLSEIGMLSRELLDEL